MARAASRAMRHVAAIGVVLGVCALSSVGRADPQYFAAGVSAGRFQSETNGGDRDASGTLGLWGRLSFQPWFSGQVELQAISPMSSNESKTRSATALVVLEVTR